MKRLEKRERILRLLLEKAALDRAESKDPLFNDIPIEFSTVFLPSKFAKKLVSYKLEKNV